MIYSRGFASIYGEWETVPASKTEWRTFHDSVRLPWPRQPVQVVAQAPAGRSGLPRVVVDVSIDPNSRFVNRSAPTPAGTGHGPARLGADRGSRRPAARRRGLHAAPNATASSRTPDARHRRVVSRRSPYKSRQAEFNVRVLHLPTEAVGRAPAAGRLATPHTALDRVQRLRPRTLHADAGQPPPARRRGQRALRRARRCWPTSSTTAAAACSTRTRRSRRRTSSREYLFVHEFAHHFAALADEYYTSDVAYETGITDRPEPWEPNITALKSPGGREVAGPGAGGHAAPDALAEGRLRRALARVPAQPPRGARAQGSGSRNSTTWRSARSSGARSSSRGCLTPGTVGAYEGAGYESQAASTGPRRTASCSAGTRLASAACVGGPSSA